MMFFSQRKQQQHSTQFKDFVPIDGQTSTPVSIFVLSAYQDQSQPTSNGGSNGWRSKEQIKAKASTSIPRLMSAIYLSIFLLLLIATPTACMERNGLSLKLIHSIYSPESPNYNPNLSLSEFYKQTMSMPLIPTSYVPMKIPTPLYHKNFWYMVSVGIGSGEAYGDHLLLVDTGSGVTWIQCENAYSTFNHINPFFKESLSRTYTKLKCNTNTCETGRSFGCQPDKTCFFHASYEYGPRLTGELVYDVLTLGETNPMQVHDFAFGCARMVIGYFNNASSGIFGLSYSSESFISQYQDKLGGRFSYCLPRASDTNHGYLHLGDDIPFMDEEKTQKTSFIANKDGTYFVNLIDISVGSRRMNFKYGMFLEYGTSTVIDLGSPITWLPLKVYQELVAVLDEYFRQLNVAKLVCSDLGMDGDACYSTQQDLSSSLPSFTFHFEGADLEVPGVDVFMFHSDYFFLTMRARYHHTVIGSNIQLNHRFVYDTHDLVLSFASENCARAP